MVSATWHLSDFISAKHISAVHSILRVHWDRRAAPTPTYPPALALRHLCKSIIVLEMTIDLYDFLYVF
jgi:hypothetical protein